MRPHRLLLTLIGFGALLALGACEADDAVVVETYDDFFEPEVLEVDPGTPVRFENRGQVDHNAYDVGGAWQTGANIEPGDADTVAVDEPGVYEYYCTFHGTTDGAGMAGRLVVGDAEVAEPDAEDDEVVREWTGTVRRVPDDFPSIQEGVDAADPGDLVLVAPGTYHEQVEITTPSIILRGEDRNEVVIDGEFAREMGVIVLADGVAVENLTVRDVLTNGIYWRGVTGFRGSHLTAIGAVDYGIYAFDSTDGLFEHSYASGSADGAFYVGQCQPCRIILDRVTGEHSGLGYSGTNAGGDLYIVDSVWRHNGAGIVPNTLDSQRYAPNRQPTLLGNTVVSNGNPDVPHLAGTWPAWGNGIVLPGVREALVARNLVADHPGHGILVVPNIDDHFWVPADNAVRDNVVRGSGRADLTLAGPSGGGDCFAGNAVSRTSPRALQSTHRCERLRIPRLNLGPTFVIAGHSADRPDIDLVEVVRAQPEPGPLEQLPGGADAPARPAVDVFAERALVPDAVGLPAAVETPPREPVPLVLGVPLSGGSLREVILGVLGTFVPIAIWLVWVGVALGDLVRRRDRSRGWRAACTAVVVLLPPVGVLAYLLAGRPHIGWGARLGLVGGGVGGWLALVVLAVVAAGVI